MGEMKKCNSPWSESVVIMQRIDLTVIATISCSGNEYPILLPMHFIRKIKMFSDEMNIQIFLYFNDTNTDSEAIPFLTKDPASWKDNPFQYY